MLVHYQQTGFDPFDKMIPNGFITIGNSDWYIPDNFVSYFDAAKQTTALLGRSQRF